MSNTNNQNTLTKLHTLSQNTYLSLNVEYCQIKSITSVYRTWHLKKYVVRYKYNKIVYKLCNREHNNNNITST